MRKFIRIASIHWLEGKGSKLLLRHLQARLNELSSDNEPGLRAPAFKVDLFFYSFIPSALYLAISVLRLPGTWHGGLSGN